MNEGSAQEEAGPLAQEEAGPLAQDLELTATHEPVVGRRLEKPLSLSRGFAGAAFLSSIAAVLFAFALGRLSVLLAPAGGFEERPSWHLLCDLDEAPNAAADASPSASMRPPVEARDVDEVQTPPEPMDEEEPGSELEASTEETAQLDLTSKPDEQVPATPFARQVVLTEPPTRGYGLQLAAYPSEAEAETFLQEHKRDLFEPIFVLRSQINGEDWFRVRVGQFPSVSAARRAKRRLPGEVDALIVRYRKQSAQFRRPAAPVR